METYVLNEVDLNTQNKNAFYKNNESVSLDNTPSWFNGPMQLTSAEDLLGKNIPPINWVVPDLLPEGLAILAGRPKSGKSFMALNLAISVACQEEVFGYFPTYPNKVLYLAYEDNDRRIQSRLKDITGKSKKLDSLYLSYTPNELPIINENMYFFEKLLEEHPGIKLIIIDTFGRADGKKSNKNTNMFSEDYEKCARLQTFAIQNHICILLIHHTTKMDYENVFDNISGTTGITASMDTLMVLKKDTPNKAKLHIIGRDIEESIYDMEFNNSNKSWVLKGNQSKPPLNPERQQILDLFQNDCNKIISTKEMARALEKNPSTISNLLTKMVNTGDINKIGYGKYQLPISTYKL